MNITRQELRIIWEAVSQFSENRAEDEDGEPLELPEVDSLVEKLDAHFTPKTNQSYIADMAEIMKLADERLNTLESNLRRGKHTKSKEDKISLIKTKRLKIAKELYHNHGITLDTLYTSE